MSIDVNIYSGMLPSAHRANALALLRALVGTLSQSARAVERRTGVTNAQLFLLQQLATGAALSVNELAERARTQQSTVSLVVTRLVRAGLVRKERSDTDARRAVLTITAAGRKLVRHAPAPPTATLLRGVEALSDRDVRVLAAGLAALARTLHVTSRRPGLLFEETGAGMSRPGRARSHAKWRKS